MPSCQEDSGLLSQRPSSLFLAQPRGSIGMKEETEQRKGEVSPAIAGRFEKGKRNQNPFGFGDRSGCHADVEKTYFRSVPWRFYRLARYAYSLSKQGH